MELEKEILNFIKSDLAAGDANLDRDTSLFEKNTLDSMKLTELVGFLENTYGIEVLPMELVFENLDSVTKIVAYLKRKKHFQ